MTPHRWHTKGKTLACEQCGKLPWHEIHTSAPPLTDAERADLSAATGFKRVGE